MSGGIDSAASLFFLKEQGYDVVGVYLFMKGEHVAEKTERQLADISSRIGVEIIIEDVRDLFRDKILNSFINSYLCGDTPSPCADCNSNIKWFALKRVADRFGGGYIATGHYCNITKVNDFYYLTKGVDSLKDQSYYMWQLSQDILSRAIFPLGGWSKSEVRAYMADKNWGEMVDKPESMGVCFLNGSNYGKWLIENSPDIESIGSGDIYNRKGEVVGVHSGYPFYTLAQKKGFTIENGEKGLSVVEIDCEKNILVVGDKNELMSDTLYLRSWQFVSLDEVLDSEKLVVKVRGIGVNPEGYCNVKIVGDLVEVSLLSDRAWAVTKGQPAVFYIDNRLVGGGVVDSCK